MEACQDSHTFRKWVKGGCCLLSLLMFIVGPSSAREKILLGQAKSGAGFKVTLTGSGFGNLCNHCQVIIEYSPVQRFAAIISAWSDQSISAIVPDINTNINVRLSVQRPEGKSNVLRHVIPRVVVPAQEFRYPVNPGSNKDLGVYEFRHHVTVGDKGEDRIDVSRPLPACGVTSGIFDHARIVYINRRFGEAQITALPESGCTRCTPLKVRWYHEPTGRVEYQVHIYQRIVSGVCAALRQ